MRRLPIVLIAFLAAVAPGARAIHEGPCTEVPDPARWEDVGTPDPAPADLRITVHRGAAHLAPENTIPAFEYAIAYGMDMIEVDVQQTLDARYVVLHDYEVSRKTDGRGYIFTMTYDQATQLSAAAHGEWPTSEYADEKVPGLEAVLALASREGVGINFDLKESVTNTAGVALLAAEYPGVIERSIFQPYVPARAEAILAVAPDASIMHNSQTAGPPALYYAAGAEYDWFGSDLEKYSAESIAAIHDACDRVQPNVYSSDRAQEAADLREAIARGADGAMVNHPDLAAEVLGEPVPTKFVTGDGVACLVNADNDLGLPRKPVTVGEASVVTARGGCVPWDGEPLSFAGDGSAQPTSA